MFWDKNSFASILRGNCEGDMNLLAHTGMSVVNHSIGINMLGGDLVDATARGGLQVRYVDVVGEC